MTKFWSKKFVDMMKCIIRLTESTVITIIWAKTGKESNTDGTCNFVIDFMNLNLKSLDNWSSRSPFFRCYFIGVSNLWRSMWIDDKFDVAFPVFDVTLTFRIVWIDLITTTMVDFGRMSHVLWDGQRANKIKYLSTDRLAVRLG